MHTVYLYVIYMCVGVHTNKEQHRLKRKLYILPQRRQQFVPSNIHFLFTKLHMLSPIPFTVGPSQHKL